MRSLGVRSLFILVFFLTLATLFISLGYNDSIDNDGATSLCDALRMNHSLKTLE